MKKVIIILSLIISHLGFSQVTDTGDKVGIGTTNPSEKLEVKGGNGVAISLFNDQANYWDIVNSTFGKLDFVRGKSNIFMRINQSGYVGIGTTAPSHLLSIGNSANSANLFKVDGNYSDVSFNGTHTTGNIWSFINTGTGSGTRFYVEDANNSSSRLTFDFKGNAGATNILAGTSNGNVGIGTTSPTSLLEIANISASNGDNIGLNFTLKGAKSSIKSTLMHVTNNVSNLSFFTDPDGGPAIERMRITENGNIGIGTTAPSSKLEIKDDTNSQLSLVNSTGNLWQFRTGSTGSLIFKDDNIERIRIDALGNLGIGTTDTKGFKLGVQGKIAAEEVKVATYTNWADFVFESNYNLPTLKEVEQHIKENGHLKDIPSAEEVKKDGFFLGEMDSKLLQKIEELTLYTIEQQKEIENLKKENKELQSLSKRLAEIERLLSKKNNKIQN